jgi:hypothetical protein
MLPKGWGVTSSIASLFGVGCLTSPFVRVDRPIDVRGVVVALVDQTCRHDTDSRSPQGEAIDLRLTIRIRNTGLLNARFDQAAIRLTGNGETATPRDSTSATIVRPGSSRDLDLRFVGSGRLSCDTPMTIALNDALQAGTSKRAGYSIAFLARDSNR